MSQEWIAVFDVDGVLTDGGFYYSPNGKELKKFGPDDFDALKELRKHIEVCIITADTNGFAIAGKRFEEDLGWEFNIVSNKPKERWEWIEEKAGGRKVIYVGDGLYDWYPLSQADAGICPNDSLPHVQERTQYVLEQTGGKRFVAQACLLIMEELLDVDVWEIGYED